MKTICAVFQVAIISKICPKNRCDQVLRSEPRWTVQKAHMQQEVNDIDALGEAGNQLAETIHAIAIQPPLPARVLLEE